MTSWGPLGAWGASKTTSKMDSAYFETEEINYHMVHVCMFGSFGIELDRIINVSCFGTLSGPCTPNSFVKKMSCPTYFGVKRNKFLDVINFFSNVCLQSFNTLNCVFPYRKPRIKFQLSTVNIIWKSWHFIYVSLQQKGS